MSNKASFRNEYGEHFVDPLLVGVAERLDVDLALTESPAQLESMQRACAQCQSRKRCDDWTRSSDGGDYRGFCLNVDSLDMFSEDFMDDRAQPSQQKRETLFD